MTAFRADLGALDSLVARLTTFELRAQSLAADIDADVSRLHAEWSGLAASEHLAAHRQWIDGAARMRAAVLELRCLVATAHGNYAGAATANTRMWS